MKKLLRKASAILGIILLGGCASGYSVREQLIRNELPKDFLTHTNGIISEPSNADIDSAVLLGTSSKDNNTLQYAYLIKPPRSLFDSDSIYIKVSTPLFLIADHARDQAREYRKVNDSFVNFARGLHAVRLSLTQQFVNSTTWNVYAFKRQIILVRDGVRVEPLKEIQAWEGKNPFADKPDKNTQAMIGNITQTASQLSKGFVANMTPEQKKQLITSYRAMGLSEQQMQVYTGLSVSEIEKLQGSQTSQDGKIALSEFDAVFAAEELRKPGKYEVIFRTPETSSMLVHGDKEIKLPVSFVSFR